MEVGWGIIIPSVGLENEDNLIRSESLTQQICEAKTLRLNQGHLTKDIQGPYYLVTKNHHTESNQSGCLNQN